MNNEETIKTAEKSFIINEGTLAIIKNCKGIIFEGAICYMSEVFHKSEKYGYNVYWLRHNENDMSCPTYISTKKILVNRFGLFITKDKLKVVSGKTEYKLNSKNTTYYGIKFKYNKFFRKNVIDSHTCAVYEYFPGENVNFNFYIKNERKIWKIIKK